MQNFTTPTAATNSLLEDAVQSSYALMDQQSLPSIPVLTILQASEYVLQVKTQNYHWNVTGMSFGSLHLLFEKQYKQLAEFVDKISEQIRAYGFSAPGSMAEFLQNKLQGIDEAPGELSGPETMLRDLAGTHDRMAWYVKDLQNIDQGNFDYATQNLLGDILNFHLQASWMLRAHLE